MSKKYTYEVIRHRVDYSKYERLVIRVYSNTYSTYSEPLCKFIWSTADDSTAWYSGRVEIVTANYEDLKAGYAVAGKITRKLNSWNIEVNDILDILDGIATEVFYDKRLSERVPGAECPAAGLNRWIDNYQVFNNHSKYTGCRYSALAETECQAQRLILQKAVESDDEKFIVSFIEAGKPVFSPSHSEAPDITPAREKINKEVENAF